MKKDSFCTKKNWAFIALFFSFVSTNVFAQKTIMGIIKDKNNDPLVGVSVYIKDQITTGTISDNNGSYTLKLKNEAKTVVFSFTGFKTKEEIIGDQTTINVTLLESELGLDEVVVTARKAIENVQLVPIAVATFSAKMMEDRAVSNLGQLADYIPNVEIDVNTAFGGSQSVLSPFIRGIGQNDFAITYEPAVGLYVDGVYYGRGVGSVVDMLDVERIEVLKGPQGTLFGRNTIAGAINITTKAPSNQFGVTGQLTAGSYNRLDTKVSVDLPLIEDKLLSSFSVSSVNRDGFVKRIPYPGKLTPQDGMPITSKLANGQYSNVGNSDDQGNMNNDTWRAKLLYKASDKFSITLSSDYVRVRENESPVTLIDVPGGDATIVGAYNLGTTIPPTVPVSQQPPFTAFIAGLPGQNPLFGRTPYDKRFITGDPFTSYGTAESGSRIDVWGGALTLNWDISDNVNFKSITSTRRLRSQFGQDGDNSPLEWSRLKLTMPQDQFTQEFQLSGKTDKLKYIAGLYYFGEKGSILDEVFFGAGLIQVYGLNIIENKTFAGYAQATYDITEKWSVTAGARHTYEEKFLDGRQRDYNSFGTWGVPGSAFPVPSDRTLFYPPGGHNQTFNVPTVRLGTEYKIKKDMFAYGYFAQGFKSGGWSTRLTAPSTVAPAHNPEFANTYEIGLKSEFLNNKLRLNLAGFYTDYKDLQVTVFVGVSPTVVNAAQAKIQGFEADMQWIISKNFAISANLGTLNARYTEISDPKAAIKKDFLFLNAPSFKYGISADLVSTQDFKKARFGLHLDTNYRTKVANDVENSPYLIQEAFSLFNGNVFFEPAGRKFKIMVGGTNLADERYLNAGTFNPGLGNVYGTYGRPREFLIGINFNL